MRPDLRPIETTPPSCPEVSAGFASLSPLVRGLLGAVEQRWSGSAVVRESSGKLAGVLRCRAGRVVGARGNGHDSLHDIALALCRQDCESISWASRADLVGTGDDVVAGRVDPWALVASVARDGAARPGIVDAVEFIGARSIATRSEVDFTRYSFSEEERPVARLIARGPRTVHELELETGLSKHTVARVVFSLWVTRAIALAPAWVRTVSRPPPRDDEPTAVTAIQGHRSEIRPKAAGHYSEKAPAHGVLALQGTSRAIADRHFELAELLLERGHPREAVFEAQKALRLCQPRPEQEALYAWALYLRSGGGSQVAGHVWEHLENALRADPACEAAHRYGDVLRRASGG